MKLTITRTDVEVKEVSERERKAVEAALMERLAVEKPLAEDRAGNSPYSACDVIFGPESAGERGCRVALAAVCRSHNGAGHYKGRGRWCNVYLVAPNADGPLAVCEAGDRDAEEVGSSRFFVRPWATHEAEEASRGLGLGARALSDALAAVGL